MKIKKVLIKYFILFAIFISCKKKDVVKIEINNKIKFNSINIFDSQEALTRIPYGIYFEIELENFNFKTHDTIKYINRYISKFKLVTKKKNTSYLIYENLI